MSASWDMPRDNLGDHGASHGTPNDISMAIQISHGILYGNSVGFRGLFHGIIYDGTMIFMLGLGRVGLRAG